MSLNIQTCNVHDYVGTGPCALCDPNTNVCEKCEEVVTEYADRDYFLCQSCVESANEAAYDHYMDRLASGDCGPSLEEQQRQAWRLK